VQRQDRERADGSPPHKRHRAAYVQLGRVFDVFPRAFLGGFCLLAELTVGFSTWIALLRSMALSFDGPAHDLTSPAGFAPVTSHLRQFEFDIEIVANVKRGDASFRFLNPAHASLRFVRGGSTACNCRDNFFSSSLSRRAVRWPWD